MENPDRSSYGLHEISRRIAQRVQHERELAEIIPHPDAPFELIPFPVSEPLDAA